MGKRNKRTGRRNDNFKNSNGRNKKVENMEDYLADSKGAKSNDPSWYAQDQTLMNNAANLAYSYANGSKLNLNAGNGIFISEESVPGLLSLKLMPTIGAAKDGVSAVNVAANNMYSFVRHMNSGSKNYDAPDLMVYILAMDSCYSYYSFLTRLYGVMRVYTPYNYYLPKVLVEAMNVDFTDIETHLPDLLYYINSYSAKLSTLRIPTTMPYLSRHMWMYSGVYSDEEGQKGQLLMYNPDGFYKYHETIGDDTSLLGNLSYEKFEKSDGTRFTLSDLIKYGNDLLEVNRASEDHNIMSGDIAKAYGNNVFTVPPISMDYTVVPVYDEEVLNQMHNATILKDVTNNGLVQDRTTGVLTNELKMDIETPTYIPYLGDRLLNMHKMDPTSSDNMVATRLMAAIDVDGNITNCGSEICVGSEIWSYYGDEDGNYVPKVMARPSYSWYIPAEDSGPAVLTALQQLATMSKFKYHPCQMVIARQNVDDHTETDTSIYFDLYNYTIVHLSELERMHEVALLSEFGLNR